MNHLYPIKKIYLIRSVEERQYEEVGWYRIKIDETFTIEQIVTKDDICLLATMNGLKSIEQHFQKEFTKQDLEIVSRDIINLEQIAYCIDLDIIETESNKIYIYHFRLEFNDYVRSIRNKKISEIYDN